MSTNTSVHQESSIAAGLQRLKRALRGESAMVEIILSWYRCGRDVERVRSTHPTVPGDVIHEIVDAYLPVRSALEHLHFIWIAANAPPADCEARLDEWVALTGMRDPR